ncbi:8061_t:CDS:2 [Diversispora eburnea]|uniref:8061_t:CDS:1 n=1 Tax=Diversispora eburnea TaxID=1213867 RepID=A0A9N8WLX8_9GLOM|nr:8061_t:CDS:2 [Diversispora eburnea]
MSLVSSDKKNLKKTTDDRKKIGQKGNRIFRLHKDYLEFGTIEVEHARDTSECK